MRRNEKEIIDRGQIDAIINASQVCRVALAKDNQPYLVPLSFGYDGRAIYLHTAVEGKKIDYFEANNRVCVEFERSVRLKPDEKKACKWSICYESVIGDGTIQELTALEDKQYGLNQIMRHYSGKDWDFDSKVMAKARLWKITITSLCGKHTI
jgi:nitroimidazol reductase NimA-like FMN-containing flavoprotein (pyridoxamine 5'-phosphate oxidase superfamily)